MLRKALFRLWSLYFVGGAWEADGRVYERLGARRFKKVLFGGDYTNAALSRIRGRKHRTIGSKRAAYEWLVFTMVAEIGHGVFFLVMVAIAIGQAREGEWRAAGITCVLNLVINVIPIMVQRYNRARIVRAFRLDATSIFDLRFWAYAFNPDQRPPDAP